MIKELVKEIFESEGIEITNIKINEYFIPIIRKMWYV